MDDERIVVDTSVILKWFHPEEDTSRALRVLEAIEKREVVAFAPDLLIYETVNAWTRGMKNAVEDLPDLLASLYSLPLVIVSPEPHIMVSAGNLGAQHPKLSVYDASFLALAIGEQAVLYTADAKLKRAVDAIGLAEYLQLL